MMDPSEFAQEIHGIYRRLWLVAAGIVGERSEADDIVQEAAMIAFGKRAEFRPGTNFAAWLTTFVKGCASNHRRKTLRRRTVTADPYSLDQNVDRRSLIDSDLSARTAAPLPGWQAEFDDEMFHALNQLATQARCCLLLRVVLLPVYYKLATYVRS